MEPKDFIKIGVDELGNSYIYSTFPMDKEYWFDIPDYEGLYQISNWGNVKSLDRIVPHNNGGTKSIRGKLLSLNVNLRGYKNLSVSSSGTVSKKRVHKLAAMTFLNHTPCGYSEVVDHIDGDKLNNNISNLRLVTNRFNTSTGIRSQKSTSKYAGVSWQKTKGKFRASIRLYGEKLHLGVSNSDSDLSELYQKALSKYNADEAYYRDNIHNLTPKEKRAYLLT